jgi:hypothetical protein
MPCVLNKIPYILNKMPYILNNMHYVLNKMPCVLNKMPYILNKMPYILNHMHYVLNKIQCVLNTMPYILNKMPYILNKMHQQPLLDPHIVFSLASFFAAARKRREGRNDDSLQGLADDDVPCAELVPRETHTIVESDSGAAQVKQNIVNLFRSGEDLRTLGTEDARAADGQHRQPVLLQRISADDAVQEPLRAPREFQDDYTRHGKPKRVEPKAKAT